MSGATKSAEKTTKGEEAQAVVSEFAEQVDKEINAVKEDVVEKKEKVVEKTEEEHKKATNVLKEAMVSTKEHFKTDVIDPIEEKFIEPLTAFVHDTVEKLKGTKSDESKLKGTTGTENIPKGQSDIEKVETLGDDTLKKRPLEGTGGTEEETPAMKKMNSTPA
jgi:hypothetical protein